MFERGQRGVDFFFVLDGTVEVFERKEDGSAACPLARRLPREFTGELDLFNDRQILVRGRAGRRRASCASSAIDFRRWSEPSPTSARSSCARSSCAGSACSGTATATSMLVGSSHSAATRSRLQQLPDPQRLSVPATRHRARRRRRRFLEHFSSAPSELPVVIAAAASGAAQPVERASSPTRSASPSASIRRASTTSWSSAPGRPGSPPRSTRASEGLDVLVIEAQGARRPGGDQLEDRELSRLPDRHLRPGARRSRAQAQAQKFGARLAIARARHRARLRRGARSGRSRRRRARCARAPSSSRPARGTASSTCRISAGSRGRASTTRATSMEAQLCARRRGHRRRRRQLGRAGGDVPSRTRRATSTCWSAAPVSPRPCRATWSGGSRRRRTSPCTRTPRLSRSRATSLRRVTWRDRGTRCEGDAGRSARVRDDRRRAPTPTGSTAASRSTTRASS